MAGLEILYHCREALAATCLLAVRLKKHDCSAEVAIARCLLCNGKSLVDQPHFLKHVEAQPWRQTGILAHDRVATLKTQTQPSIF